MISSSSDDTIKLWNLESGECERTFQGKYKADCLAVTVDSAYLLSGSWTSIHVWDIASGQQLPSIQDFHTNRIMCLALTPDGSSFVSGSRDHTLALWRLEEVLHLPYPAPAHSFRGHSDDVECAVVSSDGNRLFSGSHDGSIRLWDMSTGQEVQCWEHAHSRRSRGVMSLALSGSLLVSGGSDCSMKLWQLDSTARGGQLIRTLQQPVHCERVAIGGNLVVSAENGVRVLDPVSGRSRVMGRDIRPPLHMGAVNGDGSLVASYCEGVIYLWDLASFSLRMRLQLFKGHDCRVQRCDCRVQDVVFL